MKGILTKQTVICEQDVWKAFRAKAKLFDLNNSQAFEQAVHSWNPAAIKAPQKVKKSVKPQSMVKGKALKKQ